MEVAREASSELIVEEWSGTSSTKLSKTATITASPSSIAIRRSGSRFSQLWRRVLEAFVPEGYPSSVTPDYVTFQIWDSLQGLSTYVRTMLSTQALLSAIGVGETSATVIGATFQWFLRDLTGMLGGILFTFYQFLAILEAQGCMSPSPFRKETWLNILVAKGSSLDSNAKMWRLVADLMNDLGMLMDLLSPLFPSAFVFIVCLGSLSRSFTGVASGATRAALTQHFALQNNAADIAAKEGSQETLATMVGMAMGMLLARITTGLPLVIWFSFLSLTMFHMYANYKAVRCLSLTTLNCERSSILLLHFMETGQVLSPKEVSIREHVLPLWITSWSSKKDCSLYAHVCIGARVSSLNKEEIRGLFHSAGLDLLRSKYLLLQRMGTVNIVVHKDSTAKDVLQAFIQAIVMAKYDDEGKSMLSDSKCWIDQHYDNFILKLQSSGWKTERLLSPSIIWRADWRQGGSLNEKND